MPKSKKVKPSRGWAVVEDNEIRPSLIHEYTPQGKLSAEDWCNTWQNRFVIPVRIVPVMPERKRKP